MKLGFFNMLNCTYISATDLMLISEVFCGYVKVMYQEKLYLN